MSEPAYNTDAPDGLSNSRFQQVTLGLRGNVDVVIDAGGRGGGKTDALCKAVLAHCSEWGATARPLVVRESHGGLLELQSKLYELCLMTTEGRASRNKADNTITLPTGGVVTFTNVGDEESYVRHQGKDLHRPVRRRGRRLQPGGVRVSRPAAVEPPRAAVAPVQRRQR